MRSLFTKNYAKTLDSDIKLIINQLKVDERGRGSKFTKKEFLAEFGGYAKVLANQYEKDLVSRAIQTKKIKK